MRAVASVCVQRLTVRALTCEQIVHDGYVQLWSRPSWPQFLHLGIRHLSEE